MKIIVLIILGLISIRIYAKKCADFSTQKKHRHGTNSAKNPDKQVGKV